MFRVWSKIVVASLVILGVDVFASDSKQRIDQSYEAGGNAVQRSLPAVLDDFGYRWNPSEAGTYTIRPDINPACRDFVIVTPPVTGLLKYHLFSPRAPPFPAS